VTLCAKQPRTLPAPAENSENSKGCLRLKGSRAERLLKAPRVPLLLFPSSSRSKATQTRGAPKTHTHTHTKQNTRKQINACSVGGGRELERGGVSSSYLSLSALALNECSSALGHITFVLFKSLWTAERYWASFDHRIRLNFKSDTKNPHPSLPPLTRIYI